MWSTIDSWNRDRRVVASEVTGSEILAMSSPH
jgi:hypothetical protein